MTNETEYECIKCGQKMVHTRAVPEVPELSTVSLTDEEFLRIMYGDNTGRKEFEGLHSMYKTTEAPELTRYDDYTCGIEKKEDGWLCDYDQAAAVIAAKDGRITAQAEEIARLENDLEAMQHRAETAEAKSTELEAAWLNAEGKISDLEHKLAQIEKQKSIGHIVVDEHGAVEQSTFNTSLGFEQGVHILYFHPVASDADLRAERDRYKQALEFYADISKYPAPLTGGLGALWSDCGGIARAALNPSEPQDG